MLLETVLKWTRVPKKKKKKKIICVKFRFEFSSEHFGKANQHICAFETELINELN